MLTLDVLKEWGADTQEGLQRCMGMEPFYLKLVKMGIEDKGFEALESAIGEGDLDKAFEAAHALKGVLGNLSLTPLCETVNQMTEMLRRREQTDYSALVSEMKEKRASLMEKL